MKGLSRKWVRVNVLTQTLLAIAAFIAANVIAFDFRARVDLSRAQKFSLAGQTKRVIRALRAPVEITVYFSPTTTAPVAPLYKDVKNLLDEFVFSGRRWIRVEYINPVRDLTRARELQARYKFRSDENLLIIEYEGRVATLPIVQMAEFDVRAVPHGGDARLVAFKGEQALTSALIGLISPEPRKVYFLQGQGQPAPGPAGPLSIFSDTITRQNVSAAPLSLAALDAIPPDAGAVFLIAPMVDLPEREVSLLSAYWDSGGKFLTLLEPNAETPRLNAFLASTGLRPRDDRVLRTVRLGFATGILREVTADFLPENPITRRLVGLSMFFPGQTQSIALEPPEGTPVQLRPLIQPAEEFWGEVDYVTDETRGVRYDDGHDTGQPLYVAASAERGGIADDRVGVGSSRLVVVGSSEFALDAALSPHGLDFLSSATHWLLDRAELTGIAPKATHYFSLNLSQNQLGRLTVISLLVMPGAAGLLALLIWIRRRS